MRVVLIPRWGGGVADDFYPWLARTIREQHAARLGGLEVVEMPEPHAPEIGLWTAATRIAIGVAEQAAQTILVGHSVGFQAVMRTLAELEPEVGVYGALGVAAWWRVDAPWPALRPWIDAPFDVGRARSAAARIRCVLSDDDPFTRDHAATRREFEERLGAMVTVVEGAGHFNTARAPAVLDELIALSVER